MKVLLIEDDILTTTLVKTTLGDTHFMTSATSASQAEALIRGQRWDLALVDLNLETPLDGLPLISRLKAKGIFTVVISAHEEAEIIESCYRAGCDDYYAKGDLIDSIPELIKQVKFTKRSALCESVFETSFLTQDEETKTQARTLINAVQNMTSGLIMGETGTGKSELVKVIFKNADLKGQLIELNCAGLPKELIESELFGYDKGAFTGADKNRVGKVTLAHEGILFLDEIGCLPLEVQAKFLKVLEEKKFYPVGGVEAKTSQFRLIAATNEDLFALAAKGLFRLDLLQRLCGSVIQLKPLRQRPDDIWLILKNLPAGARRLSFSPEAKQNIIRYQWSGNIRELKRFHEFCLARPTGRIDEETVKEFILQHAVRVGTSLPTELIKLALEMGLDELTEKIREQVIREVLERNSGHVGKTMTDLKVSTRQFYKYQKNVLSGVGHVH